MQRKPGFPVANCSIKMPDGLPPSEPVLPEDDGDQQAKRQQLINFGHSQWGFNNWSWSVTKQDLDFVDFTNGKYCAGVVAFVSVTVKSFDIHRENIGYATTLASNKGFAIYKSRKCAVTNALRETLLSFGGTVATELMELLETHKTEFTAPEPQPENNINIPNKPTEPKNSPHKNIRKDSSDSNGSNVRPLVPAIKNAVHPPPALPANQLPPRPPMPPANARPAPPRPNNEPPKALEAMSEEEARAERKRRQQLAKEEFRQKQLLKQATGHDDKQELLKNNSSLDHLLLDIPTQDIVIEETGEGGEAEGKRKSPALDTSAKRRMTRLHIVTD